MDSSIKFNKASAGQYLTFFMKGQLYGVPIGAVREINRVSAITPLPRAAEYFAGVMNLRGKVIPVIDLRLRLGMERAEHTKSTCIIVIETEHGQTGTIVDSVSAVIDLTDAQIELPPSRSDVIRAGYVIGMGKLENTVVILLDIASCLAQAESNDPSIRGYDSTGMKAA